MRSIKFSDQELDFMRQQYAEELANAEKYIEQIKDVLRKIGGSVKPDKEEPTEKEPTPKKLRGRKPKVKVIESKEPKKRGRPKSVPTPVEELPKKKRGRKPKAVPTYEIAESAVAMPVAKKSTKKITPKPKKNTTIKPNIAKTAIIKKTPKVLPSPDSVPTNEVKQSPIKEIKKVVKKRNLKRRAWKGSVRLAPLSKPLKSKEPVVEPVSTD